MVLAQYFSLGLKFSEWTMRLHLDGGVVSAIMFEEGQRVQIRSKGFDGWATIEGVLQSGTDWVLFVRDGRGSLHKVTLTADEAREVSALRRDGAGNSAAVLAGLWNHWMASAGANGQATLLASSPLHPYPHQSNAVYGAMLPQPRLRFLLADEPGTGKTIMAGLYLREMQKLGLVNRALVVVPAGLVSKWQADFARFFGGELRRITNETVQQYGLAAPHDAWVVSLELAAMNPAVQEAIRVDRAGWDLVVFDEAHRLTPTAGTFHRVGLLLSEHAPRALLMTATPHRGSEWLFRHLLHLVDPEIYPVPGGGGDDLRAVKPGPIHFLRRMKEDLVDYDGTTKLFKGRRAHNLSVPLNAVEASFYREALELVDEFFPSTSAPLARMVYGKRAASSLYALAETLRRRRDGMGTTLPTSAAMAADPDDEDDWAANEARVVAESSRSAKGEKNSIGDLLTRLEPLLDGVNHIPSKWRPLVGDCLRVNGIVPGLGQAVVFTEYADSADWLVGWLVKAGFSARRYSGRDNQVARDQARADFMAGQFQVIVSTDAGNEGIDLQSAHVLINFDIPWSLVRLEQRMGRIHRVGQTRDVELYNLIAVGTREGEVLRTLLERFVAAANQLDGRMFDSLSLVAELVHLDVEARLADAFLGKDKREAALAAVRAVNTAELRSAAERVRAEEAALASQVDVAAAIRLLNEDTLGRLNPAVVESFLGHLHDAGVVSVARSAAGEGIVRLTPRGDVPLPAVLGASTGTLAATSGRALLDAQAAGASVTTIVRFGPGEEAFESLLKYAEVVLEPDVFRGGFLTDPTGVGDYDLFAFEGDRHEAGGARTARWSVLIRMDETGARDVRWETLANLVPTSDGTGSPHKGRELDALAHAEEVAAEEVKRRREAMSNWFAGANQELDRLPSLLSRDITDRDLRLATRQSVTSRVAERHAELDRMAEVRITNIRQVAWARVEAAGPLPDPSEADSERIAMAHVRGVLRNEGWKVADVSAEHRGYDLYATRGPFQRCVEVKGVWGEASSSGIRMTGNEVLVATQQRSDYWLYVVDRCVAGGRPFGAYQDPVAAFGELIRSDAVFRVPGSALSAAKEDVPA